MTILKESLYVFQFSGIRYKPPDALRIGMVDEIVPQDEMMDRAKEQIEKWIRIPGIKSKMQHLPLFDTFQ